MKKKNVKQVRGQLTPRIKTASQKLLGYKINQIELRLMPYYQFRLLNNQTIDPVHLNEQDFDILHKWQSKKFITITNSRIHISKKFWDAMSELIFLGYVDLK